jgi:hypothetical protein
VNVCTIAALIDPEQWDLEFEVDDGSTEDGEFVRDHYITSGEKWMGTRFVLDGHVLARATSQTAPSLKARI